MVKGITTVTAVTSEDTFEKLRGLFDALGFEPGKGWSDATGRGAAFLAPIGNLEFVTGRPPAVPPILVEVTALDSVHAIVRQWMASHMRTEDVDARLSPAQTTHWHSRLFTAVIAPDLTLG